MVYTGSDLTLTLVVFLVAQKEKEDMPYIKAHITMHKKAPRKHARG